MADVMISYTKADRLAVLKLAALLGANGYSTWWDAEMRAGDEFRNVINNEIRKARAVVVVWSSSSVLSTWVRAEASLGQSLGKLVPIKAADVNYNDIPLPFGELNTPNIDDETDTLNAVRTALTRPATCLPWHQRVAAKFRYETLAWLGLIGGALTLAASVAGLFKISEAFGVLIANWTGALRLLWRAIFLNQLHVGPYDAIFLTILSLVGGNLVFAIVRARKTQNTGRIRAIKTVGVAVAFLILTIVGLLGAFQAEDRNNRLAEEAFGVAIANTFHADVDCASIVRQVEGLDRGFLAGFAHVFPEDDPEVLEIMRRSEECFTKHGISMAEFAVQRSQVNIQFNERGRDYVGRFGTAFALSGHVLAPILIYLCLRLFTRFKLDVGLFSRRLWLVIFGAVLLLGANSMLAALEAVDWRSMLERA